MQYSSKNLIILFSFVIECFWKKCREDTIEVETEINKMITNEKVLAEYYSEDPTTFTLDEFFQIFRDLCSNITKILEVNENNSSFIILNLKFTT
jgi:hypothetical protein